MFPIIRLEKKPSKLDLTAHLSIPHTCTPCVGDVWSYRPTSLNKDRADMISRESGGDRFFLTEEVLSDIYGAVRSELYDKVSVQGTRNIAAAAGFEVARIPARSEERNGSGSRAELFPAMDRLFGGMPYDAKITALCIMAERLIKETAKRPGGAEEKTIDAAADLQGILGRHGYQFLDGTFVPVDVLDKREAQYLPSSAASEIARATTRLVNGDYSGAITSACGAVDLTTQSVYQKLAIADPGSASFSEKVNTSMSRLRVFDELKADLIVSGMPDKDAQEIADNTRKATNHAAQALQVLRRSMGDAHGSRPAIRRVAYDSIKWALAICGLLEGKT